MGLGTATGINYYGPEASGTIIVPGAVSQAINDAIGQGDVTVSPLQMARLVAAVANGGTVYKPYLVQQVGGADSTPVTFTAEPEVVGEIGVSQEVLDTVKAGMCEVTQNEDLGTGFSSFGNATYVACGKTGTAQTDRYPTAWFVAYAPADNPQIAVVVVAENSREGADVAAPIVRRIIDHYLDAPLAEFPRWWNNLEYIPVDIPEGATGG
jgi:penicillin-binding protein 2